MIKHIVLVAFKSELREDEIADIFAELHRIENEIEGLTHISSGRSQSPEHMERGYMHGFVAHFDNWEALKRYQEHPDHRRLGAMLIENAVNGRDGILVFDLPSANHVE